MSINNGGPAFPQPCTEGGYSANSPYGIAGGGLSMRDYFAAMAMLGQLSGPALSDPDGLARAMRKAGKSDPQELIAYNAYSFADAMLKAREAA